MLRHTSGYPGAVSLLLLPLIVPCAHASAAAPERVRKVLVLHTSQKDLPAALIMDASIRATFKASSDERIEVFSEYMDFARFADDRYEKQLVEQYHQKYRRHKIDLIIPVIAPALDFVLKHRDHIFPGVPVVYCAIYKKEAVTRRMAPDVIGIPAEVDMNATLDLALQLHPDTRRVVVAAGASELDLTWIQLARQNFREDEENGRVEFVYLAGLSIRELLDKLAHLPERTVVLYLQMMRDADGNTFRSRDGLERLAEVSSAPIYGLYDTYLGHGIVGGRLVSFEVEGKNAARLGLSILAGGTPQDVATSAQSSNTWMFDGRQLRRWGISEDNLPPGSIVRYRELTVWELYKWHVIGGICIGLVEAIFIAALLVQRVRRRRLERSIAQLRQRSEEELRKSEQQLRILAGKLLQAQEMERRVLAREMHDDLTQRLAVLAIQAGKLEQRLALSGPDSASLTDMRDQLIKLSEDVHTLSRQLHPSILDDLGLIDALRSECASFQQREGIAVELRAEDVPAHMPKDVALCLYRIAQEALRNIGKYAQTRHAQMALFGNGDELLLSISDQGKGFDAEAARTRPGLGLASMQERARLIGAELSIQSQPGQGTTISTLVSLQRSTP